MTVSATSRSFALSKKFCCLLGTVSATLGGLTASALAMEAIAIPPETTATEAVDSEIESAEPNTAVSTENDLPAASAAPPAAVSEPTFEPTTGDSSSTDEVLAQVTSVSELSDVAPGDWAFTALQRLVEEYGCLEGYPDRTFRGDRALTRYEFAAALNACLDVGLQALPGEGDDRYYVGRLQEEFNAELIAVRAQLDPLEADVAELQANQFPTTTKLSAQIFTHLNYTTASGDILAEGRNAFGGGRTPVTQDPITRTVTEDPELIFTYLTWLNFTTSFTGQDRLVLQLAAGDGSAGANAFVSAGLFNTYGTPFTLSRLQQDDEPVVRELFYSFPVGDKLSFTIGPRVNWYRHFDNNRFTFFLTGANSFNASGSTQANAVDRGAGVVAEWDIANWLDLRLGYLAENTEFLPGPRSSSDPSRGAVWRGKYAYRAGGDLSNGQSQFKISLHPLQLGS